MEDYEEMPDEEERLELQQEFMDDVKEEQLEEGMLPDEEKLLDKFRFLNEVRGSENTIRTSFLTKSELGKPLFPVRFWLELASYAKLYGYDKISDYFIKRANNITDTGLSNEGFLLGLVVTRRRETTSVKRKAPTQEKENENKLKY